MEGRRFIKMHSIPRNIVNNEIGGDWVTVGVLVNKLPPKTAANVSIDYHTLGSVAYHSESVQFRGQ